MPSPLPDARALARGFFLSHSLAEFLTACTREGVPVIVLKGAALAETVYPHPGLRDFRDIDVLIHPADLARTQAILQGLGYAADAIHWDSLVSGEDCQADFAKETPGGPVIIELHTDLVNNDLLWGSVAVDVSGLWERAEPATLGGVPAQVLGPEDQLLHLCLHLAGHYFDAPRSVQDMAHVCRARQINWALLVRLARRSRTRAMVWLGLRQSGVSLSDDNANSLLPNPAWRRRLLERWTPASQTDLRRLWFLLHLLDSPLAAPRVLLRVLYPTRRWLRDHYAPGVTPAPGHLWLFMAHARFLWKTVR